MGVSTAIELIQRVGVTRPFLFASLGHLGVIQMRCGAARPGDWVRRLRFWREITRGARAGVCALLGTRAVPSKARSPDPATRPYGAWTWQK